MWDIEYSIVYASVGKVLFPAYVIRPLSGISSFSNDTVRFTNYLFTLAIAFFSIILGELKFDR